MKPSIRIVFATLLICVAACTASAQQAGSPQRAQQADLTQPGQLPQTPQEELQQLTLAVHDAQAQVDASQRQLLELRRSLAALERRLGSRADAANSGAATAPPAEPQPTAVPPSPASPSATEELSERIAVQASEIATLNQAKVESESRYPVKLTGLILFNGFVNNHQVDLAAAPTAALTGNGSAGASLRQTILGIDARGPHLAGAESHADLRVDFFGDATGNSYNNAGGLLRFRTAHGTLDWSHTQAFFMLDRPIISPNTPSSLTAVANPPLAWSGNLWTWSPQVGVTQTIDLGQAARLSLQAALIDVPDPPSTTLVASTGVVSQAQFTRVPGSELHLALLGRQRENSPSLGVGGYFSPHRTPQGFSYNAWAGTLDARTPLPHGTEFSGSFYRGVALGGLGGGGYKDYLYAYINNRSFNRPLDDVGGWAQLKKHAGSRLEFNAAAGFDNPFAQELHLYEAYLASANYQAVARNRTFFGNVIYSPSAYLLFSLEYRHITTYPIQGQGADTNVFGLAAAYKF